MADEFLQLAGAALEVDVGGQHPDPWSTSKTIDLRENGGGIVQRRADDDSRR